MDAKIRFLDLTGSTATTVILVLLEVNGALRLTCDIHPSGLYNVEEVVSTNINKINELISSLVPMQ